MKKVVVVNGMAEHGKDAFCTFFKEAFFGLTFIHSTVETVKLAARVFGVNEVKCKGDKERRLWSDLKDAYTRYNDGPFREIVAKFSAIEETISGRPVVLFCHVREPEEIARIKALYGDKCGTLLVVNDRRTWIPNNHADQNVFNYKYDWVIENDGTPEDLQIKAKEFIGALGYCLN